MNLTSVVAEVLKTINSLAVLLITVALVLFFWGIVRYVYKSGDARGKSADKDILVWGLVVMFVAVSIWGILQLMCLTFFGNRSCAPEYQSDYGNPNFTF